MNNSNDNNDNMVEVIATAAGILVPMIIRSLWGDSKD